ncbi:MAG: type IV pilus assembly protein PilM [Planctomycetota bacterium]|jgi:type IV pilus assembly protein PilM
MATAKAVWGIDIGRCALTAVKLRLSAEGAVELAATDYVEHSKILSQPDADRHALIGEALEKFLSRNDVSKDDVVVSVPGQHTLARFTKLPPVDKKKIPDIVKYEADQQIPFDMDEVIWDYQTFQQEDLPDVEVGIFAMKRELVREHLLHFEQAAIEPKAVQPTPIAVYNAVAHDESLEEDTTIILDIGADNTDLIIATPRSFWTRTIQKGGNSCTDALVKSFKLSFSKAENLKRTAETSKYRRQIFQAMRPVFADLVQELQRSIGFYSSTHRDATITRIFAVGNAFKLPGLQKYLQQNLGLDVVCPEQFSKISPGKPSGSAGDQILSLWSAYGLALHGLGQGSVDCNLLPTEIAKQIVWRKKKPAFAAAAACLVLAGGAIWFRQSADMRTIASAFGNADSMPSVALNEASRIINTGPSASKPLIEQAASVLKAGESLKKEYGALSGQGEEERALTEEFIRIQANKAMVPRIYTLIHESLPVTGDLGNVEDPDTYARLVSDMGVTRGDREEIWLDFIDIQYTQDVNETIWPDPLLAAPDSINEPEAETPGFKITVRVITPNKDGRNYVARTFLDNIYKAGRKPYQGFYIDRAHLMYGGRYEPVEGGNKSFGSAMLGGARSNLDFGSGRPKDAPRDGYLYDHLTDEPLNEDWQFEIWIDVILEDLPESAIEETEGEEGSEEEGD